MGVVIKLKTASTKEIANRNNKALVKKIISDPSEKYKLPKGIVSLINFINENRESRVTETAKVIKPFKIDSSWNCDVTIESKNQYY